MAAASPSSSPTAVASSVTSEIIVHVFQAYDMFLLPQFQQILKSCIKFYLSDRFEPYDIITKILVIAILYA